MHALTAQSHEEQPESLRDPVSLQAIIPPGADRRYYDNDQTISFVALVNQRRHVIA